MIDLIKSKLEKRHRQNYNIRHLQIEYVDVFSGQVHKIVHVAIEQIYGTVIVVTHENKTFPVDILQYIDLQKILNEL